MAEAETKQPEKYTSGEETSVENITAPTETVANKATLEQQAVEEKKASDDKTEEKPGGSNPEDAPSTKPTDVSAHTASKNVQEGRAWNNRDRDRGHGGRGRGGRDRRGGRDNNDSRDSYKRNIKSDLTTQEESSDPVAIRKQVEFYFSDSNLLTDRFLFERVGGHENNAVPISTIHSFKRMRHFQPTSAIIAALKDSATLDLVDDNKCIKRKYPLSDDVKDKPMVDIEKVYEDKAMAKSVYAKGFGEEGPGTQFDIEAFFAEFGPTNVVRLRRTYEKVFKGSVFVEFDTEETQKKFLALDPKPKWKGTDLVIKSKKQYCDDKVDDIKSGRVRPNEKDFEPKNDTKEKLDSNDWKARRAADQANGFQDRRDCNDRKGSHKGFGSSGQRGRGGRGRGRDRNDERNGRRREERNEHDPKPPTIQSTSPPKASKPKTEAETTPSKPTTPPKSTAPRADEPETSDDKSDKAMADAPPAKIKEAEPNSQASAPAPPTEESKKRHREAGEGAAFEGTKTKMQKVEENGES